MSHATLRDRVLFAVDALRDEVAAFTSALVRVPTVNPPGDSYEDCARVLGDSIAQCEFDVEYVVANGRPEHTPEHPRVNVVGRRRGAMMDATRVLALAIVDLVGAS